MKINHDRNNNYNSEMDPFKTRHLSIMNRKCSSNFNSSKLRGQHLTKYIRIRFKFYIVSLSRKDLTKQPAIDH